MDSPASPPAAAGEPRPPEAARRAGADPYGWLRDVDSPEVLALLAAERGWYRSATGHLGSLTETLRSEMTRRVPTTDRSVSWRHHGFSYYTVLPAGRDYEQLFRYRDKLGSDGRDTGELVLDANELVDDSGYLQLGLRLVSPDGRLLAYSVDRTGDEVYALRFRDLATGSDLADEVPRTYDGGAWTAGAEGSWAFLYTVHDEAYRPFQVRRHVLGTPYDGDDLVLEEPDERFEVTLHASRSGALVIITATSRDTAEVWALDAHDPHARPWSVGGRRPRVEYAAEHLVMPDGSDRLLLVTDDDAVEFRLASCPVPRGAPQDHRAWRPERPEDPAERLERVDAFAGHVVLSYRAAGQRRLRLLPLDRLDGAGIVVTPRHPTGTLELARNDDPDVAAVTVLEESYAEPPVWSDVALDTGECTERHRQLAPGHDPARYVCSSTAFPSPDGSLVPVTLVRHRDTPLDGTAPALLYGYGAYEATFEPEWDPALPSLLDRGVVFAHAHVRGGGEGGRRWWLDGRLGRKQHTFDDHLAVADGLAGGVVDGSRLATRGLSAGGLLQGAVLSQRPERWRAVVAEVPFVDVVTTMLDASIPLTVAEWDEWGDPRDPEQRAWLAAYSPYDNLPPAGGRPDLLVTGALHDPRVMVWEPAKWVAALRHSDPAWSPRCLFRVETGAGSHAGPSGRYGRLGYEAEVYAWVLDALAPSATDARISSD